MDGFEYDKKFSLDDMVDMDFDQVFKLLTIWLFQYVKTTNVQRLGDI